jgi:hypothetical protein
MTKHIWYDEIVAYANGKTIQAKLLWDEEAAWVDEDCPNFGASKWVFRIKEVEPYWWENIPKHGVLCWVDDYDPDPNIGLLNVVIKVGSENYRRFVDVNDCRWDYATPLTNEEIKQFLRGE